MMSTASRPAVRTDSYWVLLHELADGLVGTARQRRDDADAAGPATMRRLLNIGYGPGGVLDLSAIVVLMLIDAWPDHARDPQGRPDPAALLASSAARAPGTPTALRSGPFSMAERPSRQQHQRARELEQAVANALRVDPTCRTARSAARQALAACGHTVREATGIYASVCDLVSCLNPTPETD